MQPHTQSACLQILTPGKYNSGLSFLLHTGHFYPGLVAN